ncbi:MAG: GNAT family N-acetyltransferase [Bdellovibrionota bacterium]
MDLETERLILNSFKESDANLVAKLAGDKRVVEMTASIPHPYENTMALTWIRSHQNQREKYLNYIFAIRLRESGNLIGCINIFINSKHDHGYLGYWIGYDYWNNGYCSEAVKKIIKFGFEEKKVNKIWAEHKTVNTASGKVMEKSGMKHEGVMRSHFKQDYKYYDISVKSILRHEYEEKFCNPSIENNPSNYHFSPLTKSDLYIIENWLQQPHVKQYWDDGENWKDSYEKHIPVTSSSVVRQFMVFHQDQPIGYIQFYWASKVGNGWWESCADDIIGIDQYIGIPNLINKGHGAKIISEFISYLKDNHKISKIITDPRPDNIRAIRCYEKVGFKRVKKITTPDGDAILMEYKI